MKIVSIGQGSDLIKEMPSPPNYLGARAKYHFKKTAEILISANSLKRVHLQALELMAVQLETWEWAYKEIQKLNKKKMGSGFKQVFATGATNITTELAIMRDSHQHIMKCIKQFGLDPKSEKDLKSSVDPSQGDLFEGFKKLKSAE